MLLLYKLLGHECCLIYVHQMHMMCVLMRGWASRNKTCIYLRKGCEMALVSFHAAWRVDTHGFGGLPLGSCAFSFEGPPDADCRLEIMGPERV